LREGKKPKGGRKRERKERQKGKGEFSTESTVQACTMHVQPLRMHG